jgi:hypothetical protein
MTRRSLFTRQFWREYRRELYRARRDGRARNGLFLRTGLLLYTVGVLCWYGFGVYSTHDNATYLLLSIMVGMMLVVLAVRYIAHKLDERRCLAENLAATPPGIAGNLRDLAYGALAVTERALSELWLANNTVPEGFEPIGRRIQIEALRKTGTWTTMPAAAREWMMRPDGSWALQTVADVLSRAESLHTLLWALYLTKELRPLEGLLGPVSIQKIAKALQQPLRGVRPTWDLRVAKNRAQEYFVRVLAECVHRGTVSVSDTQRREQLGAWAEGFHGKDAPDLYAGNNTISELDNDDVDRLHRSAAHRVVTLEGCLALMDGEDVWLNFMHFIYQPLLRDTQTPADEEAAKS